ncbi:MAG: endonuclease/exonuclease/phosphatase family protein [Labilithrix sp.]|nr:endonuclease/exonuclease/phosphatase family protein [Labilithrix sp.]MCW5811182.1 endonuclease/exonuclease/phosphatase family protein [Labilithrix sp.]
MVRRLFSVVLVGSMFAGIGCAAPPAEDADSAESADAVNEAAACNPLPERTTANIGDVTGMTAMEGTPFPSLGPDAAGYFHPPYGYTEGGTFAEPSDGKDGAWKVEAKDVDAAAPAGKLRVVEWNVERGNKLDKSIRLMKKKNADVWLLNETDLYGKNSGGVVVAREIARALGYSYYTGIEFYERRDDRRGTSGNAIVSRYPLTNTKSIDIPMLTAEGGHDWSKDSAEPRCGMRNAVSASIEAPGAAGPRTIDLVSLHTENKANREVRLAQFDHVVKELVTPGRPTVVAGDLNTLSPGEGPAFRKELEKRIAANGRDKSLFDCSRGDDTTTFSAALIVNMRIDWLLVQSGEGATVDCAPGSYEVQGNDRSSDHKPVVVEMTVK